MADAEALAQRVLQAAPRGALHALLLPDGADLQAARAAFRRLSLLLHPDKCAGSALAAEAFKAVNVALHSVQEAAEARRERGAGEHSRWREFDACGRAGVRTEAGSCAARGAAAGCQPRMHAAGPQLPAAPAPSARRWAAPVLPAPPPPPARTPAAARKRSRGAGACRAGPDGEREAERSSACELGLLQALLGGAPGRAGLADSSPGRLAACGQAAGSGQPAAGDASARLRWAGSAARRPGSPARGACSGGSADGRCGRRTRRLPSSSSSSEAAGGGETGSDATSAGLTGIASPEASRAGGAPSLSRGGGAASAPGPTASEQPSRPADGRSEAASEPRPVVGGGRLRPGAPGARLRTGPDRARTRRGSSRRAVLSLTSCRV